MRIGFGAPVSGAWATPHYLGRFAAQAEAAGYGSLWTFQRLLVPEGSAMEPVYHSVLDPMVALGYAAAVTSRIRLGVAVVNMPYLSPGYLAKQAASVDVLSGGRLDLGLGLGWMPEEFAAAGGVMAGRGARTAEYIEVLRRLWAGGVAEFHGEHYTVPAGRAAPLPVQRPGPPVLRADRDLAPGPVLHPGHKLVAVAGLGGRRPLVQPLDLLAHRRHGARVEQRLPGVLRGPAVQPVLAQVVAAALENRERRRPAEQRLQGRREAGQVAVDQLALQCDRRGRHHHTGAGGHGMGHRRDQIGE